MGKSSRAYRSREIKGQRREVLEAAEKTFGVHANDARKAALEVAAAQPPVPVVRRALRGAARIGARACRGAVSRGGCEPPPSLRCRCGVRL